MNDLISAVGSHLVSLALRKGSPTASLPAYSPSDIRKHDFHVDSTFFLYANLSHENTI